MVFESTAGVRRRYLHWGGTPFNALFLSLGSDPGNWLGASGSFSVAVWVYLAGALVAGVVSEFLGRRGHAGGARAVCASAALACFLLHGLGLALHWGVALVGISFCFAQAWSLLRPVPAEQRRIQLVRAAREGGNDIWIGVMFLNFAAAGAVLLVWGYQAELGLAAEIAFWLSLSVSLAGSCVHEIVTGPGKLRPFVSVAAIVGAVVLLASRAPTRGYALTLVGVYQFIHGFSLWRARGGGEQLWRTLVGRPAWLLASSFLAMLTLGTILLTLPAATPDGQGLGELDALFTATSATCVTGLIVVDTATDLSQFGQLVVLALLQIGGLGIMTISTFAALLVGRQIGLREELAMEKTTGETSARAALRLVKFIVSTTAIVELAGAALLIPSFRGLGFGLGESTRLAVFHSISAFCNAGFSLFTDSLESVARGWAVPGVVAGLIVLGGLGFGVLQVLLFAGKGWRANAVHVRLVLAGSLALWLLGAALLFVFERGHGCLHDMPLVHAVKHAAFQSVTARTAGFNTIDMACLGDASSLLMCGLMFIGAAPGSTGGGVKVTTLLVLVLLARAVITGRESVTFAGRRIGTITVRNASALVFAALLIAFTGVLILLHSEDLPGRSVVFEVFSALGTVGLSQGVTADLSGLGKVTVVFLMYIGRIGPLTMLLLFVPRAGSRIRFPAANVMVG